MFASVLQSHGSSSLRSNLISSAMVSTECSLPRTAGWSTAVGWQDNRDALLPLICTDISLSGDDAKTETADQRNFYTKTPPNFSFSLTAPKPTFLIPSNCSPQGALVPWRFQRFHQTSLWAGTQQEPLQCCCLLGIEQPTGIAAGAIHCSCLSSPSLLSPNTSFINKCIFWIILDHWSWFFRRDELWKVSFTHRACSKALNAFYLAVHWD